MTGLAVIGRFMRGHWKILVLALVIATMAGTIRHRGQQLDQAKAQIVQLGQDVKAANAAHADTKSAYRIAQSVAKLEAEAIRLAQENAWKDNANDVQDSLSRQLATARADAGAYSQRLRAIAGPGSCASSAPGQAGPAQTASAAKVASGASGMPALDDSDLQICAANTVKALGWQAFYQGLRDGQAQEP